MSGFTLLRLFSKSFTCNPRRHWPWVGQFSPKESWYKIGDDLSRPIALKSIISTHSRRGATARATTSVVSCLERLIIINYIPQFVIQRRWISGQVWAGKLPNTVLKSEKGGGSSITANQPASQPDNLSLILKTWQLCEFTKPTTVERTGPGKSLPLIWKSFLLTSWMERRTWLGWRQWRIYRGDRRLANHKKNSRGA